MVPDVVIVTTVLASLSVFATAVCAGARWMWRRARNKLENKHRR
jgi:hypothetical protein